MISSFALTIASDRIKASAKRGPLIATSYVVLYQSMTSSNGQNVKIWRERKTKGFSTSPLVNFENATNDHHEALLDTYN